MRIRDWWQPSTLVTILCVGAVFIMVLGPLIDPDVFWHLANGRLILATGSIPRADPFSFTKAGTAWICHEWLTEVGMYALYNYLGPAALMIIGAYIITASFALVLTRCRASPYLAASAQYWQCWPRTGTCLSLRWWPRLCSSSKLPTLGLGLQGPPDGCPGPSQSPLPASRRHSWSQASPGAYRPWRRSMRQP